MSETCPECDRPATAGPEPPRTGTERGRPFQWARRDARYFSCSEHGAFSIKEETVRGRASGGGGVPQRPPAGPLRGDPPIGAGQVLTPAGPRPAPPGPRPNRPAAGNLGCALSGPVHVTNATSPTDPAGWGRGSPQGSAAGRRSPLLPPGRGSRGARDRYQGGGRRPTASAPTRAAWPGAVWAAYAPPHV